MYKLYTDKNENFSADVSVKNASLKNSVARLVVETAHVNLVFKGTIEESKCVIPIKKLKGILDENTTGRMYLEIIVEDVYFKPWESDFQVEEHTSMKVVVKEQVEETSKPVLEVKVVEKPVIAEVKQPAPVPAPKPVVQEQAKAPAPKKKIIKEAAPAKKPMTPAQELALICERVGVGKGNFTRESVMTVLKEYFHENQNLADKKPEIIKEFFHIMGETNVKE